MAWHSGLVFTGLDKAWRVIYSRGSKPVLIERKFGPGSVVFSTDDYFMSNEAMQKDRHADLLAWVVGSCPQIVFDESHFGIVEEPGVATLVRKYRLHGLVVGLLLLAGLFIWKNSVSFAPPYREETTDDYVMGKDSAAGFVNLLRRHITSNELLNVCLAEWKKSAVGGKYSAARMAKVQATIDAENARPAGERNAIRTYQAICRILKENAGATVSSSESKAIK
jgi:hypothetical protein